MKEVEITLKVDENLDLCIEKLQKKNFTVIRNSFVDDIYLTQNKSLLKKDNIDDILKSCVLIRQLKANGEEFKKITYKNKMYDGDKIVSEEKINVNCDDLDKARKLFEALGFEELIRVRYKVTVVSNRTMELAFQEVEDLGLLVEHESYKDLEKLSDKEIMKEKENMIQEIKKLGISIESNKDIKKAHELIFNKLIS